MTITRQFSLGTSSEMLTTTPSYPPFCRIIGVLMEVENNPTINHNPKKVDTVSFSITYLSTFFSFLPNTSKHIKTFNNRKTKHSCWNHFILCLVTILKSAEEKRKKKENELFKIMKARFNKTKNPFIKSVVSVWQWMKIVYCSLL